MKKKTARRFLQRNHYKLAVRRINDIKGTLEEQEIKARKALKK